MIDLKCGIKSLDFIENDEEIVLLYEKVLLSLIKLLKNRNLNKELNNSIAKIFRQSADFIDQL